MIILIMAVILGFIFICFGLVAFCRTNGKRKWMTLVPIGIGLGCFTLVAILILALMHFGEAPRDGDIKEAPNKSLNLIKQAPLF